MTGAPESGQPVSPAQPAPAEHPLVELTDAGLAELMQRAIWITLVLGGLVALVLWIAMGWRNAALLAVGAAVSAASLWEWQRLIRLFNARLDRQQAPRGASLVVSLFLLRIVVAAAVIYGSLKCFQGSPVVLVCGLGLAIVGLTWESFRLLRS